MCVVTLSGYSDVGLFQFVIRTWYFTLLMVFLMVQSNCEKGVRSDWHGTQLDLVCDVYEILIRIFPGTPGSAT